MKISNIIAIICAILVIICGTTMMVINLYKAYDYLIKLHPSLFQNITYSVIGVFWIIIGIIAIFFNYKNK